MNMENGIFFDLFFNSYTEPFTAREFLQLMKGFSIDISLEEAEECLYAEPRVFCLENQLYLTKAGAFCNKYFSIKPTRQEIEQELFIAGDRCMPFVNSEIVSCYLNFEYKKEVLKPKIFNTNSMIARDLFTFFGDEWIGQYLANDPANKKLKLEENDFELPTEVNVTGVSLKKIIEDTGFEYGDRLLCHVKDWANNIIVVEPVILHDRNPFEKNSIEVEHENWNRTFEECMLKSFEKMGPCGAIEEQLSFVFYDNMRKLCVKDCSSIHEMIDSSEKIGMEMFGVETRLWRKGESVPAVGNWNKDICSTSVRFMDMDEFDLPVYIIDCYLKDMFFEKQDDIEEAIRRIIPKDVVLTPAARESVTLQIRRRSAIIRKKYNWFADFAIGNIRHKALELYSKVGSLVYDIDCTGSNLDKFPQKELVILSQLFAHIMNLLEVLSGSRECPEEEANLIGTSLEGMEYNFEDIRVKLVSVVKKLQSESFEVI